MWIKSDRKKEGERKAAQKCLSFANANKKVKS